MWRSVTPRTDSVMLIRSRGGHLRSASQMSPLVRHLRELWEEDIHLYAFADENNAITPGELLDLMTSDAGPSVQAQVNGVGD
jgi:hypothetical protein